MRKNILYYFLTLAVAVLPVAASAQTMADYTCYPAFITNAVTPNILIVLDVSGSMNLMAYGYGAGGYYYPNDFNPTTTYYGYFDPTARYTYGTNQFDRSPTGNWNGNFLNWLSMRRVDVARKVLVGGLATSRTGGGNTELIGETPAQESRKYFKFYSNSSTYAPYSNNHVYKISKGKIEVYSIDTPANFNFGANYMMYCNAFNGHDALCEDVVFDYTGSSNQDGKNYNIYPRKASEAHGGCDYNKYNYTNKINGLTYVTSYVIKVDKVETAEPAVFDEDGNITGVLQRIGDKARFGTEFFNNDGSKYETDWGKDGGYVASSIGGNLTNMVTNIENKGCDTWTPLAESIYEGVRYYRQDSPYYAPGDFSVNQSNDPFYYQDKGQYVECGKNFILLITDGESTMDLNIPAAYQDYDSDGNDPGTYADSGSDYLDDVALWGHANDMRSDLEGRQEVTLYTVFAFGSGSQLLMNAAKNGGFIDRDGDDKPDTVGDGRGGEWSDFGSNLEWDEDGDGVPDTYFEAPSGNELEAKIIQAITAILQRAASGTAVSILSTSSEGEGSLFQAFFKPFVFDNMREIHWVGYLNALWVDPYGNLREDTVHDDAMVYSEDKIIRFKVDEVSGETSVARYHDADGDGKADSDTPYETVLLSELDPQWEAGKKLAFRDPATRTIKTWVDIDKDSTVDTGEFIDFNTGNASTLRPFLYVDTDAEAARIIRFIRGESVTGGRDRNITINGTEYVWKLGDIVYSTPTVVGKPMENYHQFYSDVSYAEFFTQWKERGVSVYVGANDGMLHALKAGSFHEGDNSATALKEEHGWYSVTENPATTDNLGEERWAYIPYNLLPHLKWLADPGYTHVYYVDLKPKVTDVRIFKKDADHPNGWGTILIGGMRLGGGSYTFTEDFDSKPATAAEQRTFRSAYFMMDVTVPNNPVLLGEFTDANLKFTTAYPAVARIEATEGFKNPEDDKWFFVVGSGPSDCDANSSQNGYAFVYDLNTKQLVKKFTTSESNAFMANPVTIDIDLDYNVDTVYIGETYVQASTLKGKMYRISCRTGATGWTYQLNPTNWVMTTLFSASTPITSSATAAIDEQDNVWVYFGTGKYYSSTDKTDTTTQNFYGIKDPCPYGGCTAANEVTLAQLYNSSNIIVLTNKEVVGASATTWDAFVDEVQADKGWYINLVTGGERVLNRPSVLGGVVLFSPFKPDADVCGYGGTGSLYALYYETGTAYYKDILGTEAYGDEEKSIKSISLDKGITSEIGLHVGQKSTSTGFIQQGTGSVVQIEVDPALTIKSGMVGWKQY